MNKIEEFVNQFPSKHTKNSYRCFLNNYFNTIREKPETYFNNNRDYEKDVLTYWESLKDKAPLTKSQALSCIKVFLQEYDIDLKTKFLKKLKRRSKGSGTRPLTLDKVPNPKQLKEILQHGNIQSRALFLIASSSGCRIDEILQLKTEYIDFKSDPVTINIPGSITKTGESRVAFISNEAADTLKEWLKVRKEYLIFAVKKCNHKNVKKKFHKNIDDPYIFPFSYNNSRDIWNRLINKADYKEKDTSTGRYRYHIHSLRKYFRTRLGSEIPVDVVEVLMGHSGYLTGAYRRYSMEQLKDFYKKGVHALMIFEKQPDLTGVHEEMQKLRNEKDKEIQRLNQRIEMLDQNLRTLMITEIGKVKKKD